MSNSRRRRRGLQARIHRELGKVAERVRVAWEEYCQPQVMPKITQREFLARFGADGDVWKRLIPEFGSELGLACSADAEFLFSFVERLRPRHFLEIGTWRGTTAAIVKTISPDTQVMTVNHPDPEVVNNALRRDEIGMAFRRRGLDVKLIWADSANLPNLGLPKCDMIFVDGDHSYVAALRDLTHCWQLLEAGGFLLFHDLVQPGDGFRPFHVRSVASAYRKFEELNGSEFATTFQVAGTWLGTVQKAVDSTSLKRAA